MHLRNTLLKACGCSVTKSDRCAARQSSTTPDSLNDHSRARHRVAQMSMQDMYRSFGRQLNLYNMYPDSSSNPPCPTPKATASAVIRAMPVAITREAATISNLPTEVRMQILRNLLVIPDEQPLSYDREAINSVVCPRLGEVDTDTAQRWTRQRVQDTIEQRTTGLPESQCHDCDHLDPPTSNKLYTSISLTERRLYFEALSAIFENHFICFTATHDLSTDPRFLGLLQRFRLSESGHINGSPPHNILPMMTIYMARPNPEHIIPLVSPTYMFPLRSLWSLRRVLMYLTHSQSGSRISIEFHVGSIKERYDGPSLLRKLVLEILWPYIHGHIHRFCWADIRHTKTDYTGVIKAIDDAISETSNNAIRIRRGSRWTPDFCIHIWDQQIQWLRQVAQRGRLSPATEAADILYSELSWEVFAHRLLHDITDILELYETGFDITFVPHAARLYLVRRMQAETHYYVALIHLNEAHISSTESGERMRAKRTSETSTLEALTNLHLGRNVLDHALSDHLVHTLHFGILTFEAYIRLALRDWAWAQAMVVLMNLCPAHLLRDKPEQILSDKDQMRIKRQWADSVVKMMSVEFSRMMTMESETVRLATAEESSWPNGGRPIVKKMQSSNWEAKSARGLVCKILLPKMRRHFADDDFLRSLEVLRVPSLTELGIDQT